ncbi:MAG TPA: aminopeptidase P family protein, partial [Draconibacterium sp.]|nr:aminopeptidase P family protein [Draconibacterium sp.]
GIDAWYISGTDPHSSEYLPDRWKTRAFISGFTGSYGIVIVTQEEVALWTDTRYFLQAAEQLQGTGIKMMKLRVPDAIQPENWLAQKLPAGSKVGLDAQTVTVSGFRTLQTILQKKNIQLVKTPDLFETIWENRPSIPSDRAFELDVKYSGLTRQEKQLAISAELTERGADLHAVTMLDELAWLFNLRGSDIDYNPVFTGFGLIGANQSILFVDDEKLDESLRQKLQNEGVEVQPYTAFYSYLNTIEGKIIWIDPSGLNYSAYISLAEKNEILEGTSVISILKSRKNSTELDGFRKAMQKDGAALVEFLYWLKETVGKRTVSEYEVGVKLKEFRSKQAGFMGESFPPIVGYREHGAIVHLSVGQDDALPLEADGILLFDSGGQYLEGTTDITRTIALGQVTDQQKEDYTLVLKGMIALSCAVFPYGTKGCNLDILARQALWNRGLNYGHGTGHGVGHFLNVHEGPMAIRQELNENRIEPGNVLSNEPAFYREGQYGLRTENMIVCVEKEMTEYGRFLGFETLTLCPIDTTLILPELLTTEEKIWLNDYHTRVNRELKPFLVDLLHDFLDKLTLPV